MDIKIYEKPVVTKFVMIDGIEFRLEEILSALSQIDETNEDDRYGEYSLRDYEIEHLEAMDQLVKLGLVKNYTGSRMANLYCIKDKKKLSDFASDLYELYDSYETKEREK